jgi:hypothetical protein
MHLTASELTHLKGLLMARFGREDFRTFLLDYLTVNFNHLTGNHGFKVQLAEVLGKLNQQGKVKALLQALEAEGSDSNLVAFTAAVGERWQAQQAVPWYQPPAPRQSLLLGRKPFVNRSNLRNLVPKLLSGTDRVVAIHGATRSGMSYTYEYLSFIASAGDTFETIKVDLADYTHDASPRDVMTAIALKLGGALSDNWDEFAQQERTVKALLNWFEGRLRDSAKTYCLFFDTLDRVALSDETAELIYGLAALAEETPELELRVILVGVDAEELDEPLDFIASDRPQGLPPTEVKRWLTDVGRHAGKELDGPGMQAAIQRLFPNGANDGLDPRRRAKALMRLATGLFA